VAIKIKGSQGNRRVEWLKVEHPFTAICPACEVHTNHNEALNSCIRRCNALIVADKTTMPKQLRDYNWRSRVQQLMHNWMRPHDSLGNNTTPAMAIGFCARPVTMLEFLTSRGFSAITN
jgi:hypothetical protein